MTLILVALAWLAGIALVAIWALPAWAGALAVLATAPLVWVWRGRKPALLATAMALAAFFGAWRFQAWQLREPPSLMNFVEQEVIVEGTVLSEPDPGTLTQSYVVRIDMLINAAGVQEAHGQLRASLGQDTRFLPGTKLRLHGLLADPPVFDDFDYRHYLYEHGIVATMSNPEVTILSGPPLRSWRRWVADGRLRLDHALQRALPEPETSLAGGIAFGRDGNLPDGLASDFRDTGLAHIVAVSGSNVSLVAGLVFGALTWLIGRKRAFWVVAPSVAGYVILAGLSASVVRAGIMAVVFVLGAYFGRPRSSLAALGAAAMLMTFVQPAAAQDVGFQLSLAATAGLIVFAPWIRYGVESLALRARLPVPGAVSQTVALTLSATAATVPIVVVNFGRLSLVGPLVNVVVEPLFVVAFWLSLATAAVGSMSTFGGWLIGLVAYYPLGFITWFARTAADVPFAAVDLPSLDGGWAAFAYAVMCVPGWFAYRYFPPAARAPVPTRRERKRQRRLLWTSAGAAALVMAIPVSLLPIGGPGELRVTLLDTAAGDALLIETPHGQEILVDGGTSGIQLAQELGAVLPHWEHDIDALFVLEADDEHADALPEVARRYAVGEIHGAEAALLSRGDHFTFDGVAFELLWPPASEASTKPDDLAAALRISYGGVSILAVADISAAAQARLLAEGVPQSTVLVLPHSGANTTDIPFVRAVAPAIALIPVGTTRYAATPAAGVLESLQGRLVLRNDEHGRITIRIDGHRISYSTQR